MARAVKDPARAAAREVKAREMERSIEEMAANGLTPQQITLLTGLKPERLYKGYKDSMLKGGARRVNEVAQSAYLMSVGGPEKDWRRADAGMAKFWLERMGGQQWRAPNPNDDPGPDLTRLTVPQLIELQRALRPLAAGMVMIDGQVERDTVVRSGDGGADAAGAGAESDRGVGVDQSGSGEVPQ